MRRWVKAIVVSLLAAVMLAGCAWGPKYPINYVQQNAKELANQPVTVLGVVSNSQVVPPKPLDRTRGEYDLTDENGTTIHVTTQSAPPANGGERTVHAIVKDTTDHPYLEEQPIFVWLYGALGVLVVLAMVLIYLMMPSVVCQTCRARNNVKASVCKRCGTPLPGPGPKVTCPNPACRYANDVHAVQCARCGEILKPPPGILCPSCRGSNDLEAEYCEHCGERLKMSPPIKNDVMCIYCRTLNEERAEVCSKCGEELGGTMIAVADLTILDGGNIETDSRYALKKTLKHTIGRAERSLVCLKDDRRVSEQHARVGWSDDHFFIQDEDSTNGTMVNDQKVTRQLLAHGDIIRVGNTRLKFTLAEGNSGQQ